MSKVITLILVSSIVHMCIDASDMQKNYSYWVYHATTVSIYNHCGNRLATVSVERNPSLKKVKTALKKKLHIKDSYTLHPLHNQFWRLGCWRYADNEVMQGKIKDHMDCCDTDSFWIKEKPRKPHQS
jgi:hypothetical protein